jgi:hypothetical protein
MFNRNRGCGSPRDPAVLDSVIPALYGSTVDTITKKQLLDRMAPCSLFCHSCVGFTRGAVQEHAAKLHGLFTGYYEFQAKNLPDAYKSHAEEFRKFDEKLSRYAAPKCNGCRNNPTPGCCIKGCFLLQCTKDHDADFCGECAEFPCRKAETVFADPVVLKRWLRGNSRIKEAGAERFYAEEKDRPHYVDFKKTE